MSLVTPLKIGKLQRLLHEKAKAEPSYRFYSLYDKICRIDILHMAYRRCRSNKGAPGPDNVNFSDIERDCLETWLGKLQQELVSKEYKPMPLLRVWIPKANGKMRPLGIPIIRDRVVQMAVVLVLNPIFEADFTDNQYGFRPGLDAKLAARKVFFQIAKHQRTEIVDGDLKDYFNQIPHGALMRSISRRIADGHVLTIIKRWLECPVVERDSKGEETRSTPSKDLHRGTPQGGVISPLLANIYFRRFSKHFENQVTGKGINAFLVNYADDFVICCQKGFGQNLMNFVNETFSMIGIPVNEEKTKLLDSTQEKFDFLGFEYGIAYNKDGKSYYGTRPSRRAMKRIFKRVHDETSRRWNEKTVESRIKELNPVLRGWLNYFNQGPLKKECRKINNYTIKRLRRWLMMKHKQRGTGYRQYSEEYIYKKLGLFKLPVSRTDLQSAKS